MSIGAVSCAICWVEGSFNYSTMSSTSYKRSWNLPIQDSSSFRWLVVWAAVYVGFVLVCFWLLFSGVFFLSSIRVILSTKSSTTFSRWSILFYCVWFTSFYSTISSCSFVMSLSNCFHKSLITTFLSSCSCLAAIVFSPSYLTLSSRAFPAVWTVLICSSAWSFHVLSTRCFPTRSVMWAAWFLRFPTTWDWKWLISLICLLTVC